MGPLPAMTVLPDKTALDRAAARLVLETAARCVSSRGRFTLALSGGSTPRGTHRLLAREPLTSAFPWDRTFVFWVDERCVSPDDPASNYGAALTDFIERVPLPRENVFPMPGTLPPHQGASAYADLLSRVLGPSARPFPRFDLALLGLGKDGHMASLFPGDPALDETQRAVVPVRGGTPDVHRLTLTLPVLTRAGQAVFIVSGLEKAPMVKAVFDDPGGMPPAARILENALWLLDAEAASFLTGPDRGQETGRENPR